MFFSFSHPSCSIAAASSTHDRSLTNRPFSMADADIKPLPPLPPPDIGGHQYGPTGMAPPMLAPAPMHHPDYDEYADDGEYYHPEDYDSADYGMEYNRLSTITERTERSEYSKHYPSARQVAYRDSISSNTEYGAFRGVSLGIHDKLTYSSPSLKTRGSLQPLLRLHHPYLRITTRSRPCLLQDNGTPWGWKCTHDMITHLPKSRTSNSIMTSVRTAPLPLPLQSPPSPLLR